MTTNDEKRLKRLLRNISRDERCWQAYQLRQMPDDKRNRAEAELEAMWKSYGYDGLGWPLT